MNLHLNAQLFAYVRQLAVSDCARAARDGKHIAIRPLRGMMWKHFPS
jgi:hypothetical protein